jgi:alpha-1,2-mannosyltransferase
VGTSAHASPLQAVITAIRTHRNLARILLVLAFAFLVASVAQHARVVHHDREYLWHMIDLGVYRWGARQAYAGQSIYSGKYIGWLPFTYPPVAAVLFMPLNELKYKDLRLLSQMASMAALLLTVWITLGAAGRKVITERLALTFAVGAVALWLEPVQQTLRLGQINLLLLALVMYDLGRPDTARTKGFGVGIAAGIKLTPAIFVLYLLVTRRTRAASVAVAAFAATVALGFAVLPSDSWSFWVRGTFADAGRIGAVGYVGNQSLHGMIARVLGSAEGADPWWIFASLAFGVTGLYVAAQVSEQGREVHAVLLCALTGLLVSPISWSHHWVWAVPALALVADRALRTRTRAACAACAGLVGVAGAWFFHLKPGARFLPNGLIWLAPLTPNPSAAGSVVQDLLAQLYVLSGLAVFCWALVEAVRLRRPAGGDSARVDLAERLGETPLGETALGGIAGGPRPQQ